MALDNSQKMDIIKDAILNGYKGSFEELYMQADPESVEVAETPEQQEQGLRGREAEEMPDAMVFPEASGDFNTMGMKAPINIDKVNEDGDLVQSYRNVPPGVGNLPMGDDVGTVIETPAKYDDGGFYKISDIIEYQKGGKKLTYDEWKDALPPNLRDTDTTTYNLRGAYQAGLQPIEVLHEDGTIKKHLRSINPNTLEFLKASDHESVKEEIAWFNSQGKDAPFGPHTHKIVKDPSGYFKNRQLKYVPRKSNK